MDEYWSCMTQMKYNQIYLKHHHRLNANIVRIISAIQMVIGTGALCFLQNTALEKILFISLACSQILSAVKPYLPYEKRLSELGKGIALLAELYSEIELQWNDVCSGKISENEAAKLATEYKRKWDKIDSSMLKEDSLPNIKKIRDKANAEKDVYFKTNFQ